MDHIKTLPDLRVVVRAIYTWSHSFRYTQVQAMRMALFLLEKYGKPAEDPSRFVAMGGMPADDEDDVVFVREEINADKIKAAKDKVDETTKALHSMDKKARMDIALHLSAVDERIKANDEVKKASKAVKNANKALQTAKMVHMKAKKLHVIRHKKMMATCNTTKDAEDAMKAAEEELEKLKKEAEDKKAKKDDKP